MAYVMMAFRIAWFKVHKPLAFYAAYFSIRAKALDATCMCQGMEVCKQKMKEIEAKDKDAAAVEEDMMVTLEVCYEFYLRGSPSRPSTCTGLTPPSSSWMREKGEPAAPPSLPSPAWGRRRPSPSWRTGRGGPSSPRRSCWPPAPRSPRPTWSSSGTRRPGSMPETSQISLF